MKEKVKVFFTKEITPESLVKIYEAVGKDLTGNVGVKISTGEPGGHNYLKPELIKDIVNKLNGTIVENCTAYGGKRQKLEDHLKCVEDHGFTKIAKVDILDSEGEFSIPTKEGSIHLKEDIVGSHLENYDSLLMLSHFKGHMMGGFGANRKKQSIGIASRNGQADIHSAGHTEDPDECWRDQHEQIDFIESMAEAATAVADYVKEHGKQLSI